MYYTLTFSFQRQNIAKDVGCCAISLETLSSKLKPASLRITQTFISTITRRCPWLLQVEISFKSKFSSYFRASFSSFRFDYQRLWYLVPLLCPSLSCQLHTSSGPCFLLPILRHQPPTWALLPLIHFTQLPCLSFQAAFQLLPFPSSKTFDDLLLPKKLNTDHLTWY